MKYLSVLIIFLAITSCAVSSKGNWSGSDKKKARMEVEKVRSDLDAAFGANANLFIACYLKSVENNYTNFEEANEDLEGCTSLATKCSEPFK